MKPCIRLFLAMSLLVSLDANAVDDPCIDEIDKIACINNLIADEKSVIEARISYLNTTPGAKGDKGPAGDKGNAGPKGDQGEDRKTPLEDHINSLKAGLDPIYVDMYTTIINVIDPNVNHMPLQIDFLIIDYASLNRNIDLIQTGLFPVPWDGNGKEYASIETINNGQDCIFNNRTNTTTCTATAAADTVVNVCTYDPVLSPYVPSFCSNTLTSTDLSNITISQTVYYDADLVVQASDSLPTDIDFEVVSLDEWANYKLGMDPDDPVYLMALDRILDNLEKPEILADIISGINTAIVKAPDDTANYKLSLLDQISTLLAEGDPDNKIPELQAKYDAADAELANTLQYLGDAIKITESLADPQSGARRLRLGEIAMDSDLMYYLLVETTIDLYLDYLYDATFKAGLTQAQLDAFVTFEDKFMVFVKGYVQRWKDIARADKEAFFLKNPTLSYAALFGSQTTPNFVDDAALKLSGEYDAEQSDAVRGWHEAMIVANLTSGVFSATFAASAATASSIASAAASSGTSAVGLFAALEAEATFLSTLGAAGSIGVVAGPAVVITGALTAAIVQGIAASEQDKKDRQYEALQDFSVTDISDLQSYFSGADEKDNLANILYMWLMIDNPRSVSNSSAI